MTSPEDLSSSEIQAFITKVKSLPGGTNIQQDEAEKAAHLYLRARKRDVERAVELYKANKRMRYTENVDSIDPLEDGVRRELLSGKFTVLPTLPDDEMDATIAIFTAYRHWPPLTTHRDTLKGVLYQLDAAMMDEQSQRKGLIVLYDMRDTKYSNFDYHLCIKLLNLFKGVYPARLRKVIIIEPPFWFRAPFNVLRLFVREKMRDRIYSVGYDELSVHLPNSTLKRLFGQFNPNQHFDWLLNCLKRTGHASRIPSDYFTMPPLPQSSSIYQSYPPPHHHHHHPLLGNEFVVQLHLYHNEELDNTKSNNIVTLPRRNNTNITAAAAADLSHFPTAFHGSLRVPVKNRRCSEDSMCTIMSSSTLGGRAGGGEVGSGTGSATPTNSQLGTMNGGGCIPTAVVDGLQTSPLPRRGLLATYNSNNTNNRRMTDSMFETSSAASPFSNGRILYRSDRHFSQSSSSMKNRGNSNNNSLTNPTLITSSSPSSAKEGDRLYVTNPVSETRLSISEFITRVESVGSIGLIAEFDALFKDSPVKGACTRFAHASNRRRNRYLDVPCLDSTGIELSDNTYIHANWVDGYRCPRAYILAQGPLENTIREFWMTVWEHKVVTIIMLTKVIEGQRPKCALYWPTRNSSSKHQNLYNNNNHRSDAAGKEADSKLPISASYGEFQVTNCGEFIEAGGLYRRSVLEVTRKSTTTTNSSSSTTNNLISSTDRNRQKVKSQIPNGLKESNVPSSTNTSENKLEVYHYLYLGWPDFDVPIDSDGFLKFLFTVKQSHKTRSSVPVVSSSSSSPSPLPSPSASSSTMPNYPTYSNNSMSTSPLLVHCSAGIGRTGTFVTTDICLQQAINEGYLDVPEVVSQLRCQRAGAVQVGKQYAFIHQALVSQLSKHNYQLPSISDNHCDVGNKTVNAKDDDDSGGVGIS
ncbi:unnamed protein product [Trichobilharzia szidati]|nr:unnamed protein product [Trichobilharzia szidati]